MIPDLKTPQVKPTFALGQSLASKPMPDKFYQQKQTARPFTTEKQAKQNLSPFKYQGKRFVERGVVN